MYLVVQKPTNTTYMLETLLDGSSDRAASVSSCSDTWGARGETCGSANKPKHFLSTIQSSKSAKIQQCQIYTTFCKLHLL